MSEPKTLSDLERLARDPRTHVVRFRSYGGPWRQYEPMTRDEAERVAALIKPGWWEVEVVTSPTRQAMLDAADHLALLRVVRAAVQWGKIRHRSAADDEPLYQALAALNLKDET